MACYERLRSLQSKIIIVLDQLFTAYTGHETLVNKAIVLMQGFIQSHMQTAEHLHSEKVFRKESNISGARYHLVTTYSGTASCCPNHADRPKSQIFRSQVEFKSKFEGFKSR
ncbi:hypothetical protein M9434_005503 [Picochlorum sp. BPE23]|nr:hypothetical protein M9434_005503 [Picochlorum sp. BPE23]